MQPTTPLDPPPWAQPFTDWHDAWHNGPPHGVLAMLDALTGAEGVKTCRLVLRAILPAARKRLLWWNADHDPIEGLRPEVESALATLEAKTAGQPTDAGKIPAIVARPAEVRALRGKARPPEPFASADAMTRTTMLEALDGVSALAALLLPAPPEGAIRNAIEVALGGMTTRAGLDGVAMIRAAIPSPPSHPYTPSLADWRARQW